MNDKSCRTQSLVVVSIRTRLIYFHPTLSFLTRPGLAAGMGMNKCASSPPMFRFLMSGSAVLACPTGVTAPYVFAHCYINGVEIIRWIRRCHLKSCGLFRPYLQCKFWLRGFEFCMNCWCLSLRRFEMNASACPADSPFFLSMRIRVKPDLSVTPWTSWMVCVLQRVRLGLTNISQSW